MARKKKHEEHENHERWLVSYADFITLLFAFFVVMYSVSSVNEGKYRVLSDSLMSAFRSSPKSLDPIQVGKVSKSPVLSDMQYKSSPNVLIIERKGLDYVNQDGARRPKDSEDIYTSPDNDSAIGEIEKGVIAAMSELIDVGVINIRKNDLWLEIEIKDSILFRSGSAKLREKVIPILKELSSILYKFPNAIKVEGYTDSDKISTELFPSNWELSSARAASIARLFELSSILSERLSIVGYGDTRPVADNSTAEGKEENRRVVIVVMANNNVTKTARKNKDASQEELPTNDQINGIGLIDQTRDQTVSPPVDESPVIIQENAPITSDELFNISPSTSNGLELQPKGSAKDLIIIPPPIRLFTPIELPPIEAQENGTR